jgi:putative sterol carrier protein
MSFPSREWADKFRTALNANRAYVDAARAWEGDVLLRVLGPDPNVPTPGIHLDLWHGECRSATFEEDSRQVSAEFVYQGSAENWAKLLHREIEPVQAILNGTIQLKGNLAKAARFTRAAKELVDTAASIAD